MYCVEYGGGIEIPNMFKNEEHVCRQGFFNGSGKVTVVEHRQPYPHRKHLKQQTVFRRILLRSHKEMQNLNKNDVEKMFILQCSEPKVKVCAEFPG